MVLTVQAPAAFTSSEVLEPGRRPWRRRVNIRLAMFLVLLIALALAWLTHTIREQRLAKELILRHDGVFFYEFEPQTVTRYTRKTLVPAWLRSMIGEDYFHDVTWVRIEGSQFGDLELKQLRALDQIESLGIVETAITDDGLRHLRGRTSLKGLFLGGNWIGDSGLDRLDLASIPQLEVLELRSTLVTDAKLAEIRRRFPKLDILDDGPSHRVVAAGEGRGNHRLVHSPDSAPGERSKIPPPLHRRTAGGR